MMAMAKTPRDIDGYLAGCPPDVQQRLGEIRRLVRETVPEATEAISYQIPTFKLEGRNLVHFAAYQAHVGVYPAPRDAPGFGDELAAYAGGKGTLRFPHDRPLPLDLIRRVVRYLVEQHRARSARKRR